MAQTQDYTQDQDLLKAPPEQQHSYLMANDPDYAKSHPDQQKAYLGHLNGGEFSPKGAEAGQYSSPSAAVPIKHVKYNMVGEEITPGMENRAAQAKNNMVTPVTEAAGVIMPFAAPAADAAEAGELGKWALKTGRGLAKVGVGQYVGGKAGRAIGGDKYGDAGETIGRVAGGLFGGLAPDRSVSKLPGASIMYGADELADFKAADTLAQNEADIRAGIKQHPGVPAHAEMEEDIAAGQKERAGAKANMDRDIERGKLNRVKAYNEMNQDISQEQQNRAAAKSQMDQDIAEGHQFRVGANNEMEQDILKGRQERAAGRDVAHNDLAEARMRRGAEQAKIDAGATEGSSQKVHVLPEPREPLPGDKPGSQWAVKRRTDLVGNAKRGQPGATDVIKNQRPVVLEPREGTGYGGPRQWDPNAPPEPPEAGPTVSAPRPIVPNAPAGPNKVTLPQEAPPSIPPQGVERRATPRSWTENTALYRDADPIRTARMDDLRNSLRSPDLSPEDRKIMQAQLNDMEAHPSERNELGPDANAYRNKGTMTREEAEAATQKRQAGRNARFKKD